MPKCSMGTGAQPLTWEEVVNGRFDVSSLPPAFRGDDHKDIPVNPSRTSSLSLDYLEGHRHGLARAGMMCPDCKLPEEFLEYDKKIVSVLLQPGLKCRNCGWQDHELYQLEGIGVPEIENCPEGVDFNIQVFGRPYQTFGWGTHWVCTIKRLAHTYVITEMQDTRENLKTV